MTTLPRWSRRLSFLPLEPFRLKAGASRGGSKVPERRPCSARGGRRRAKWVPNATRGRTSAPARSVLFIGPLQRDARRFCSLHEAVVDVALEGNGARERFGLQGKLHQIVELLLDHPQISIGHTVGRVFHDVLDDRPVLIEVLSVGGDLGRPGPMVSLSIEPMAGPLHVIDEVGSCVSGDARMLDVSNTTPATEKRIVKCIDEAQEELARMVADGFSDIHARLGCDRADQKLRAQIPEAGTSIAHQAVRKKRKRAVPCEAALSFLLAPDC